MQCAFLDKFMRCLMALCMQKAIQECEKEWTDNKKLIDLSQKDIRKAVCIYSCNDEVLFLLHLHFSMKIVISDTKLLLKQRILFVSVIITFPATQRAKILCHLASRCVSVCVSAELLISLSTARHFSLGSEGNVLYPVLSSLESVLKY